MHREAWVKFAQREGTGAQAYVRFANMLITDAQYLLVGWTECTDSSVKPGYYSFMYPVSSLTRVRSTKHGFALVMATQYCE